MSAGIILATPVDTALAQTAALWIARVLLALLINAAQPLSAECAPAAQLLALPIDAALSVGAADMSAAKNTAPLSTEAFLTTLNAKAGIDLTTRISTDFSNWTACSVTIIRLTFSQEADLSLSTAQLFTESCTAPSRRFADLAIGALNPRAEGNAVPLSAKLALRALTAITRGDTAAQDTSFSTSTEGAVVNKAITIIIFSIAALHRVRATGAAGVQEVFINETITVIVLKVADLL